MSAQHADPPARPQPPARTLGAVVHAITTRADPDVVAEFEHALDVAGERARADADVRPLVALMDEWWPQAALWTVDPAGTRHARAQIARVEREGPSQWVRDRIAARKAAGGHGGMTCEEAIADWEAANGRPMRG